MATSIIEGVKTGTFTRNVGTAHDVLVKQDGNTVWVGGFITGASLTANTETVVGSLSGVTPPKAAVRTNCSVGYNAYSTGTFSYLAISTSGNIAVNTSNGGSGKAIYFSVSYIV